MKSLAAGALLASPTTTFLMQNCTTAPAQTAGHERKIKSCVVIVTHEPGTTQAVDFGVHKLIVLLYSSVSAPSYDLVVLDQNGFDGNAVFQESLKRFIYCRLHEDVHIGSQFIIFSTSI
jgi:hypothetical protein